MKTNNSYNRGRIQMINAYPGTPQEPGSFSFCAKLDKSEGDEI